MTNTQFNEYNILTLVCDITGRVRISFYWEWSRMMSWWIPACGIRAKNDNVCAQTHVKTHFVICFLRENKWAVSIPREGSFQLGQITTCDPFILSCPSIPTDAGPPGNHRQEMTQGQEEQEVSENWWRRRCSLAYFMTGIRAGKEQAEMSLRVLFPMV